ncbi:trehalase-like [Coccinella septempunctata]|uniref:trehalase-like n=1 Tax=Coccinella septempunctata TaxID=41139 RepID=UPI001D0915F0|nr:trehalase-like [Coccinella septempunctata]XP_044759524.1 trehalase-like [Coccinella septempunctata]XP_044759525.1 trehalase-like [Coccinella septempunctata]XP_044759526.1 trehalase-like [Coccinella septempunctata]XP_044759528.1 trehalase-like [Coccinella septempunctata]XP_044759529.1 trehalase-like [Coccinella septempunctata]
MMLPTNLYGALLSCTIYLHAVFAVMPTCDNEIYCKGNLLKTVQMSRIFPDSKTFVDMEMTRSPSDVMKNFNSLMSSTNNHPSRSQIKSFVQDNFQPGNELEDWKLPDFDPNPPFLRRIKVPEYRKFAKDLVQLWANFSRILKPDVFKEPERYSIIPVSNGFVIPGGRFREFYYWDSYWIIKGLLASGMHQTVRGMIDNFLSMVDRYGFVPNGGRIYYLNRSQPPLLNLMVHEYLKATNDIPWLKKNVHLLQEELKYWLKTQTITFTYNNAKHTLAQYAVDDPSPRPESYSEDVKTCSVRKSDEDIKNCYKDLKSGAETGWDYSSRWFIDNRGSYGKNLSEIQTRMIIPVDLNSFLAQAFKLVSTFSYIAGDSDSHQYWLNLHLSWKQSIQDVLFNETAGIWFDMDRKRLRHRTGFYPSNLAPLWSELYEETSLGDLAVQYLQKEGIFEYPAGVPTSLLNTGEQWDLPNAWPPLQSIVIMALKRSGSPKALGAARVLAKKWIDNNLLIYKRTCFMYEKYNAESVGVVGGGGEYSIQTGFGWTNGEIFELIEEFYSK